MATNPSKVTSNSPVVEAKTENAATLMYGKITAAAASRNALMLAADRVTRAKGTVEEISVAIAAERAKETGLKADLWRAVDEMERAVQAHDIAVRTDQAARAVPVA